MYVMMDPVEQLTLNLFNDKKQKRFGAVLVVYEKPQIGIRLRTNLAI